MSQQRVTKSKNPTGLPKPAAQTEETVSALDKARNCSTCGNPARIVAGESGIHAFCGPCKKDWPISSSIPHLRTSMSLPRGLHKETLVEPDWSKVND